jgi:cation:H+ antiporter
MTVLSSSILLVIGIVLLILGGDTLVRGAVTIARRLGVSPLLVGLTVVAFGTSAPELALNVIAGSRGQTDLCFGNIVGSNIANIGLILGLTALIRPLSVHLQIIRRELPMMMCASLLLVILAMEAQGLGTRLGVLEGSWVRLDGIILLVGFAAFFAYQLHVGLHGSRFDAGSPSLLAEQSFEALSEAERVGSMWLGWVFFAAGLVMLIGGGELAGRGAAGVARALGMGEDLIGLTVVAVATSLPELSTSLAAVRKNETDIAIGNVVGSNLFNILLVLGVTSTVSEVPIPPSSGAIALLVMLFLSIVLWPMTSFERRNVNRYEGAFLLAVYVGYMVFAVVSGLRASTTGG